MGDIFGVLLTFVLLAANAFFVGSEFALISARRDRLEALAELRDMAEGMDVDILNEDGTDLTAPAKVIFGAVSLVTAFIGVSLALIVGDGLGALLGQWLGGGSGGAPPGF